MSTFVKPKNNKQALLKDHRRNAMIFILLSGLVVGLLSLQYLHQSHFLGSSSLIKTSEINVSTTVPLPPQDPPIFGHSIPMHISIPKISVDASIVELGLQTNKSIEVPEKGSDVGWYKYGPTPGEIGPSVLVGHLDTAAGAAVFYKLNKLEVGDLITINRTDGSTVTFKVSGKESYPQDNFPSEKVYGSVNHAGLRLITCHGTYQKDQGHYSEDLVVYADLVS